MSQSYKVIAFSLSLLASYSYGQDKSPVFENYSNELVSSEVYDIYQDARGKVWFATDRGLCVYDSKSFKAVETQKAIKTNAIFGIKEQNKSKVWIVTKKNEIYQFNPLSNEVEFIPYKHNKVLSTTIEGFPFRQFINHITFSQDTLSVSFMQPYKTIISPDGKVDNGKRSLTTSASLVDNNIVIHLDKQHPFTTFEENGNSWGDILIQTAPDSFKILVKSPTYITSNKMNSINTFGQKNGCEYFSVSRYFFQKSKLGELDVVSLGSEILDFDFHESRVIVGTFNGVYEIDQNLDIADHYLTEQSVSSVLKDKAGGFWFSTLGKGAFYTANIDVKVLNGTQDFLPKSLIYNNGSLVCNDNNLMLYSLEKRVLEKLGRVTQLGDIYRFESDQLIPQLGEAFYDQAAHLYAYLPYHGERNITAFGRYIRVLENGKVISYKNDSIPYITSCYQLNDTVAILGTMKGAFKFETNNSFEPYSIKGYSGSSEIRAIKPVGDQLVYLVNDELVVESSSSSYLISKKDGLKNEYIGGICESGNNSFWAFGHSGIDFITLSNTGFKIHSYNEFDHLPSQEINAFYDYQDHIFIGTKNGVCQIPKDILSSEQILKPSQFSIDSIKTEGNTITINDTIKLTPQNTGLSVFFNYLNFDSRQITIEYQFEDKSQWIKTDGKSIHLSSIKYGEHELLLRAKYDDETIRLNSFFIMVPTPILQQKWFIPVVMLLAIIPLFLLFRRILIKRQQKEQEKVKLEMSLLASRMNPHFTFNTISSIQSYVLKNDKAPAIQYLSDFGLLMRKSLDYSYKDNINFSDEIAFLKLLLTLENKRFESDFQLKVVRNDKGRNFKIPAMLLQPMIENVVLHCVFPENAEKTIFVTVDETNQHHVISIEDFGLNQDEQPKKHQHKSVGLSIVKDRIRLHNGKHFETEDFTIVKKTGNQEQGYKVTLKLFKK